MVTKLNKDNFNKEVLENEGITVVDFYAGWCGPCMMMSPIIDEIAEEKDVNIKFCKINVDEEENLAIKYGAMSIPLFLAFKNGEVIAKSLGYKPKDKFIEFLNTLK